MIDRDYEILQNFSAKKSGYSTLDIYDLDFWKHQHFEEELVG